MSAKPLFEPVADASNEISGLRWVPVGPLPDGDFAVGYAAYMRALNGEQEPAPSKPSAEWLAGAHAADDDYDAFSEKQFREQRAQNRRAAFYVVSNEGEMS